MEEEEKLLRDFLTGSKKVVEAGQYLCSLVEYAMGRYANRKKQEKEQEIIVEKDQPKASLLLIDGQERSAAELKGADSMKKNCYKRTDGRWQYSKQQNGMRYYAIANTYRELVEKIKEIKPVFVKTIKNVSKKNKKFTFLQYYQFYIDNYVSNKKMSKENLQDWQRQLSNDLTPVFKHMLLEDVTSENIQNFIDSIDKERKQELLFQRISKVLQMAYATGKIKRDITLGIEKPKREDILERRPLTLHEQIQFLKAMKKSKLYVFVIFSIIVGSRRQETLRFNLNTDVDEKKLRIHIKGTKTANADRNVFVTKEFIEFLKNNMKTPTFDFCKSYPTHKIGQVFKELKMEDVSLHSLRKTCSANLYFLGASDKYRQMQLGHASIVTTNDIYTNIKENIPPRALRLIYGKLYPDFD